MFRAIFGLPKPDNIRKTQLEEAQRMALDHKASAEYHAAMAEMYARRIERLQSEIDQDKPVDVKSGLRVAA